MAHWRWHGVRSQSSRGGGAKSENTDQATEFVKVQSRNSQRYNPSLPLFLPHMKTAFPAVFCACFNFLLQYQQVPQVTFILAWQRQSWDDQHKPWYYSTWKRHSVEYACRPWPPKFRMNRAILIVLKYTPELSAKLSQNVEKTHQLAVNESHKNSSFILIHTKN